MPEVYFGGKNGKMDDRKSNGPMYFYAENMESNLKDRINAVSSYSVKLAAGFITPELMEVRFIGDSIMDMVKSAQNVWDCCRRSILGKPAVRLRNEFLIDENDNK